MFPSEVWYNIIIGFIKYFQYYMVSYHLHIRKILVKTKNDVYKIPTKTNLLSENSYSIPSKSEENIYWCKQKKNYIIINRYIPGYTQNLKF